MATFIPRIRGNAIQEGKHWTWEMIITIGPSEPIDMASKQVFISREAALVDLRDHAAKVMKEVCKVAGLPEPADLLDLNQGVSTPIKEWER